MTHTSDTFDHDRPADDQYSSFKTGDEFVIYDIENPTGWIQSDTTVELADAA